MALDSRAYVSNLWSRVTDAATKSAMRDLAQKVEQLARDTEARASSIDTAVSNLAATVDGFEAVPAGTIIFWLGTAASIPAGWSEVTALRGRFPRGMASGGTPGTLGGADTHLHTVSHTHGGTSDSIPNHSHAISFESHSHASGTVNITYTQGGVQSGTSFQAMGGITGASVASGGSHNHGGSTGVGGGHQHNLLIDTFTGNTGSASLLPSYVDGVWIVKN